MSRVRRADGASTSVRSRASDAPADTADAKSREKKRILPRTTSRSSSSMVAMSRTTPSRTASRARRAWASCSRWIASQRPATAPPAVAGAGAAGAAAATRETSTTRRGGGGGLNLGGGAGMRGSAAGASADGDAGGGDPRLDPLDDRDDADDAGLSRPLADAGLDAGDAGGDGTSKATRRGRRMRGTRPMTCGATIEIQKRNARAAAPGRSRPDAGRAPRRRTSSPTRRRWR